MMIIFSLKNGVNEIFSNHFMTLDVFGTVFGCFILKQVSSFFSRLPKKSQIKVGENFINSVVIKLSHRNKRNWITVRKTFLTLSFLCPLQIYITITEEASSLHRAAAAVTDSTSHLYPINHFSDFLSWTTENQQLKSKRSDHQTSIFVPFPVCFCIFRPCV